MSDPTTGQELNQDTSKDENTNREDEKSKREAAPAAPDEYQDLLKKVNSLEQKIAGRQARDRIRDRYASGGR